MAVDVFTLATLAPVKAASGPIQYRALRPVIVNDEHGKLQLVARLSDQEAYMLNARKGTAVSGSLCDALNASNVTAHKARAALAKLPAEGKRTAAQAKTAEDLAATIKALPKIRALVTSPVAAGLVQYAAADELAAAAPAAPAPA